MRYVGIALIVVLVLAASVAIVARSFQTQSAVVAAREDVREEAPVAAPQPAAPTNPQAAPAPEPAPEPAPAAEIQLPVAAQAPNLRANAPPLRAPQAATQDTPPAAMSRLTLSPPAIEKVRHILLTHNIMQTESADFPLRVGAVVPEGVNLSPLPIELSDVVPAYPNYSYVIVQNQIAIVVSGSREIRVLIPVPAPS